MNVVLISTYELGRQPFGLASPAAWLRREGMQVVCLDLSRQVLDRQAIAGADLIAFYVPMHTATRLAVQIVPSVRELNARAHVCFYGLYASVNETYLRSLGAQTILGGEFEGGLVSLARRLASPKEHAARRAQEAASAQPEPVVALARQKFLTPFRAGLPPLEKYAHLDHSDGRPRIVGYTEASRGCKHLCRHCPVVPVYRGQFRIVQRDVVLHDVGQQVAAGARHVTFGDADFFNGVGHAMALVKELHRQFPQLTYDVTIKVEHLLKHAEELPALRDTGCLFVTSAVESVDDAILARLDKGHTCADFVRAAKLLRGIGLCLHPTFVAFTPWTSLVGYCDLLERLVQLELVQNVAPIQLAIRLLIPAGSKLLELAEVRDLVEPFSPYDLLYPWLHTDSRVDELCRSVQKLVERGAADGDPRRRIFQRIWLLAHEAAGTPSRTLPDLPLLARAAVPYLTEPWYC